MGVGVDAGADAYASKGNRKISKSSVSMKTKRQIKRHRTNICMEMTKF